MKIEMRDDCKVCGSPLPNARYRTYCSSKCRIKRNNQMYIIKQRNKTLEEVEKIKGIDLSSMRDFTNKQNEVVTIAEPLQ